MFHLITVPLFGARIQPVLTLFSGTDIVPEFWRGLRTFLKGCVHISAQQESYSGTVLGNQVCVQLALGIKDKQGNSWW